MSLPFIHQFFWACDTISFSKVLANRESNEDPQASKGVHHLATGNTSFASKTGLTENMCSDN